MKSGRRIDYFVSELVDTQRDKMEQEKKTGLVL